MSADRIYCLHETVRRGDAHSAIRTVQRETSVPPFGGEKGERTQNRVLSPFLVFLRPTSLVDPAAYPIGPAVRLNDLAGDVVIAVAVVVLLMVSGCG